MQVLHIFLELNWPMFLRTKIEIAGPWLLDQVALRDFDAVLDEIWKQFGKEKNAYIRNYIEKERRKALAAGKQEQELTDMWEAEKKQGLYRYTSSFHEDHREITLHLEGSGSLTVSKMQEAFLHPELRTRRVLEFNAVIRRGSGQCEVALKPGFLVEKLQIGVAPEDKAVTSRAYTSLQEWAAKYQLPIWQRQWASIPPFHFLIGILILAFAFPAAVQTESAAAKQDWQMRAWSLLNNGIDMNNQHQAIELILAGLSGNYRSVARTLIPTWFWWLLGTVVVVLIALSLPPRTLLGFTQEQQKRVRFIQARTRLLFYTVPSLIGTGVLLPMAYDLLKSQFAAP